MESKIRLDFHDSTFFCSRILLIKESFFFKWILKNLKYSLPVCNNLFHQHVCVPICRNVQLSPEALFSTYIVHPINNIQEESQATGWN